MLSSLMKCLKNIRNLLMCLLNLLLLLLKKIDSVKGSLNPFQPKDIHSLIFHPPIKKKKKGEFNPIRRYRFPRGLLNIKEVQLKKKIIIKK